MYAVNAITELMMRQRSREWHVKVVCDDIEYTSSQIVNFEIASSIISGDDFEIGAVIASQLKITLKSIELPSGAKIKPYVALSTDSLTWETADIPWNQAHFSWEGGTTEWIPLGEFYVEFREQINSRWEYTCTDKLIFANEPYISSLSYPASMRNVWNEICNSLGYVSDASVIIDPSLTVPVAPTGYLKKEVMSYIASANTASVFVGKNGLIKFKRYNKSDAAVFNMTKADYVKQKQTNPHKRISKLHVVVDAEDEVYIDKGTGTEANTLNVTNPLITDSIANQIQSNINGLEIYPCTIDAKGYPHLEIGDVINVVRDVSMSWEDAHIPWNQANFPWDGLITEKTIIMQSLLKFSGGLSMTIDAKTKSKQQSEIKVDGTISGQINKLNQSVVKQAKPYHGVTITKEDGIKVQRSDNKYEAELNSDTLRFKADGQDALWFDGPSNRFKLNATLEGADGVFSGNLSAAGGTFTGTLVGVDGTFSGSLSAATGTFSGTLNAASGVFTGALIGGAISIGSGNSVFKADTQGIYLGHQNYSSAPFKVSPYGQLVASDVVITGGNITGASNINISNDIYIGEVIHLSPTSYGAGISWGGLGIEVYIDPWARSLHLVASGGIYANGTPIG